MLASDSHIPPDARVRDLEAEVERLREALARIAEGRWNVGTTKLVSAREFAREALEAGER